MPASLTAFAGICPDTGGEKPRLQTPIMLKLVTKPPTTRPQETETKRCKPRYDGLELDVDYQGVVLDQSGAPIASTNIERQKDTHGLTTGSQDIGGPSPTTREAKNLRGLTAHSMMSLLDYAHRFPLLP